VTTGRRYSLDPLFEAMRMTPHAACLWLGCSGSTELEYRSRGVTDRVADRLAVKAGFHPFEIWPELADHRHVEIQKACAECGALFTPYRAAKDVFCGRACADRFHQRKRLTRKRNDPAFRAEERERARRYRASVKELRARRVVHSEPRTSPSGTAQTGCGRVSTNGDGGSLT
jgi:hypothetical protein